MRGYLVILICVRFDYLRTEVRKTVHFEVEFKHWKTLEANVDAGFKKHMNESLTRGRRPERALTMQVAGRLHVCSGPLRVCRS